MLVSAKISRAFLHRAGRLGQAAQRALILAATSDTSDLPMLERAAAPLGIDLARLGTAESAGPVTLRVGAVEFRHPLARSTIYANASADQRRAAHRALAAALPDRDIDRCAWHLAAAAVGTDASAALEQAGTRSREPSAYATAADAFERAGRLAADGERCARLLRQAAESGWLGSPASLTALSRCLTRLARRPATLCGWSRSISSRATSRLAADRVMRGHAILTAAAE